MIAKFKLKKHKSIGATLIVEGDLTISSCKEFKEQLSNLLEAAGKGTAEISLKDIMAIDVSAFQLMYTVKELLRKNGSNLTLQWPENEMVNTLITKTGIKQALQ